MARKPAATLLHLGPGLGNALANIHNAKKGNVAMINIVGDHAIHHLQYDAPLTADIEGIAGPMSHWVHSSTAPENIAADAAEAVVQAGRGRIATLVLPADVSWGDNPGGAAARVQLPTVPAPGHDRAMRALEMLRSPRSTVILFGGMELNGEQGLMLSRIAKASGARLMTDTFPPRQRRGAGTAIIDRLPYLAELALDELEGVEQIILVGAADPVSFFAYPNLPSELSPRNCERLPLAQPGDDIDALLEMLLEGLEAVDVTPEVHSLQLPDLPEGVLDAASVAAAVAHYLPEDAVVVDEAITSGMSCFALTASSQPHDWLYQTGGSIGWGLPAAVGAAIARPERKVICLEGDGSAMYTIQALWTMARENLDVTVVIFNNRHYRILELEFARTGARGGNPGPKAMSSLTIGNPDMNFVEIARGMGVQASRATTAVEFADQFEKAVRSPGPRLIDAVLAG